MIIFVVFLMVFRFFVKFVDVDLGFNVVFDLSAA